ncbi:DUF2510 domain-containing protein [Clavibacter sp. Sh2141]|uniref:DUF2510 domain-containing protein n=1 Tax=Clavibacter sp. Sh2141 TaxID=3395374 RepID=UPI0039BD3F26
MSAAAGWYDDQDPRYIRWWDGVQWTDHVQQKPEAVPAPEESAPEEPAPLAAPPVDRLSKRDARERAASAEAHIAVL